MFYGHLPGKVGAAGWLPVREYNRAVRIDDILLGSGGIAFGGHLLEVVFFGKPAVFGKAALREPTAVGDVKLKCNVEGCPIGSGLTA